MKTTMCVSALALLALSAHAAHATTSSEGQQKIVRRVKKATLSSDGAVSLQTGEAREQQLEAQIEVVQEQLAARDAQLKVVEEQVRGLQERVQLVVPGIITTNGIITPDISDTEGNLTLFNDIEWTDRKYRLDSLGSPNYRCYRAKLTSTAETRFAVPADIYANEAHENARIEDYYDNKDAHDTPTKCKEACESGNLNYCYAWSWDFSARGERRCKHYRKDALQCLGGPPPNDKIVDAFNEDTNGPPPHEYFMPDKEVESIWCVMLFECQSNVVPRSTDLATRERVLHKARTEDDARERCEKSHRFSWDEIDGGNTGYEVEKRNGEWKCYIYATLTTRLTCNCQTQPDCPLCKTETGQHSRTFCTRVWEGGCSSCQTGHCSKCPEFDTETCAWKDGRTR